MHEGGDWMFFGGGFMWIFWILLIVILIALIKSLSGGSSGSSETRHEDSALEILEKRYARGEIDEAEYERKRKELGS